MKKYLSVFGLYARSTVFKILLILFAMSAIETIIFYTELQNALQTYESIEAGLSSLEHTLDMAAINVYFRAALLLITFVLSIPGCKFKSNTGYTLQRLSVSERETFFIQTVYNTLVYIILIAVQLGVTFVLSQYYISTVPDGFANNQTLFLAYYRNEFLHSLLPLEDIGLWVRNALLVISFGFVTAEFPYNNRRNKFSATAIALGLYTIVYFDQGIGELFHVITTAIISLMIISEVIYTLNKKDAEVQNEQAD